MIISRICSFGVAVGVSFAATTAFAQTTIKYSNWLPVTHFIHKDVMVPWFAEIEKVTAGRVKVEVLPKVVGTAASQFDVVRDGLADVGYVIPGYTPGRFTVTEVGELPLQGEDASAKAAAFDRLYRKHMENQSEFAGVKVLSIFTSSGIQILNKTRPVQKLDDLKGLKLRSSNSVTTHAMTLVGAVPIQKSVSEAFEMLATGAIDGQTVVLNSIPGFNQLNLLKYSTILPGGLSTSVNFIAINGDTWKKISEADQKAIMAVSGDKFAAGMAGAFAKYDDAAIGLMRGAGYTIENASPKLVDELKNLLKPIEDDWIKRAQEKRVSNPEALLQEFRASLSQKTN